MHTALPKLMLPLLGLTAIPAEAKLYAVDKATYTQANGFFAAWYQDTHGRALDLCLSKAQNAAGQSMCNLLPAPGLFDETKPIAFPGNFPGEAFWFAAETSIADRGIDLLYISALEAAFSGGDTPVNGEQVSFARIRIRVTVPEPGTYTITHPYGVDVFEVNALTGKHEINMTRDIGIGSPGDFSGALKGDIGPFLRSTKGPYTATNPETGLEEKFIGDPNALDEVTGSPFGTNFVRIEGPNGLLLETKAFAVTGKLSDVALPTPLIIERASYSRGSTGVAVQQDLFTLAPPAPATQTYSYTDSVGTIGGGGAMQDNFTTTATGAWYGQYETTYLPEGKIAFTIDNRPAVPSSTPTSLSTPLVDLVTISRAGYSLSSGHLTVDASSSDQSSQTVLTAEGLGTLVGGHLDLPVNSIPPAIVRVRSSNGGTDSEPVAILP